MFKARYSSGNHSLTYKMVDLDETSNQSYVGLSQASFKANARLRYGATKYDKGFTVARSGLTLLKWLQVVCCDLEKFKNSNMG